MNQAKKKCKRIGKKRILKFCPEKIEKKVAQRELKNGILFLREFIVFLEKTK